MRRGGVKEKSEFQIYLVLSGDGNTVLESALRLQERTKDTGCLTCRLFLPC
jgi:hypothetical protein